MPSIKYKKKTYAGATFPVLEMTKAEYDALPEAKKMDGTVYMITDDTGGWEAENSAYDNSESGLTATNVQDALDEVASRTGVVYSATHVLIDYNANNSTIYSGASLTLPPGKYVLAANTQITNSAANSRQGLTITTSNTAGEYSAWIYNLSYQTQAVTINRYYNVCAILTPSVTTTYYAMIFNGNCTATSTTNMVAIKIA